MINIPPPQIDLAQSDDDMSQVSISPLSENKSSDSSGWNSKECYKGASDFKNRKTFEKETNLPSIDEDIYNNDVIHSNEFIVNGKLTVDLTTSDSDSSQGSDSDFNQVVSKFKNNCDDYEKHVSQTIFDSIDKP